MTPESIRRLLGAWPSSSMTPPFLWLFGSSGTLQGHDDKSGPLETSGAPVVAYPEPDSPPITQRRSRLRSPRAEA